MKFLGLVVGFQSRAKQTLELRVKNRTRKQPSTPQREPDAQKYKLWQLYVILSTAGKRRTSSSERKLPALSQLPHVKRITLKLEKLATQKQVHHVELNSKT